MFLFYGLGNKSTENFAITYGWDRKNDFPPLCTKSAGMVTKVGEFLGVYAATLQRETT